MAGKAYQPTESAAQKLRELGTLLRAGRVRAGMTQSDLAEKLGVSRKTLERVEDGSPGAAWGLVLDACLAVNLPADPDCVEKKEKELLVELLASRKRVRSTD